MLSMEFLIDI